MNWHEAVIIAIINVCKRNRSNLFSREDLLHYELDNIITVTSSHGKTPEQTLSRVLQKIRDEGIIEFTDNRGNYRLIKKYLL